MSKYILFTLICFIIWIFVKFIPVWWYSFKMKEGVQIKIISGRGHLQEISLGENVYHLCEVKMKGAKLGRLILYNKENCPICKNYEIGIIKDIEILAEAVVKKVNLKGG